MNKYKNKFHLYILFGVIHLLFISQAFAEIGSRIDSLIVELNNATVDTIKVHLLQKLGGEYESENDSLAIEYSQKSLNLSSKINYTIGKANAYYFLGRIHLNNGEYNKAIANMENAARQFAILNKVSDEADCIRNIGIINTRKGDYNAAIKAIERSIALSANINDSAAIAQCYMHLGVVAASKSDYPLSVNYFEKAYNVFYAAGDTSQAITCLNNIGVVYNYQGKHLKSIEYQEKALKVCRVTNDLGLIATVLLNIGVSYDDQSKYLKAIDYYTEALKLKIELDDKRGESMCYNNLGEVYKDQGYYARAIEYYEKSLKIDTEMNSKEDQSISLTNIGKIHFLQEDFGKALEYYEQSLDLAIQLGNRKIVAYVLNNIGELQFEQNKNSQALPNFEQAFKVSSEIGDESEKSRSVYFIGKVLAKQKKYISAIINLKQAEQIHTKLGELNLVATDDIEIAKAYLNLGKQSKAIEYSNKAYIMAQNIGSKPLVQDAAKLLSEIYAVQRKFEDAYKYSVIYKQATDSIFNIESKKQIHLVENRFELERKEKELQINQILIEKQEIDIKRHLIQQKALVGGLLAGVLILALIVYFYFKIRKDKQLISAQKDQIEEANEELNQTNEELRVIVENVNHQKKKLVQSKKEITDSIQYAKYIQKAILPQAESLQELLTDHFVLYYPKDIVGGDFYWTTKIEGQTIIAAADCTGHGVPGGFMSMLGISYLNDVINKEYITHPGVILRRIRKEVINALQQKGELGEQRDGMDLGICSIDFETLELQYAGANASLYVVRNVKEDSIPEANCTNLDNYNLFEIKGDRMPIAIYEKMDRFQTIELQLKKGDQLYMFSDGYADQFGGENGKRFKYNAFKETILKGCNFPMEQQKTILTNTFRTWKQGYDQIDDVMVIGFLI